MLRIQLVLLVLSKSYVLVTKKALYLSAIYMKELTQDVGKSYQETEDIFIKHSAKYESMIYIYIYYLLYIWNDRIFHVCRYCKLALKYHPNCNKDPGATEKSQEIAEAYDVLCNGK